MDVNQIIETLCEKFGIAWEEATKLVPEIIRWGQIRSLAFLALSILTVVIPGAIALHCLRRCAKERMRRNRGNKTYGLLYYLDLCNPDLTGTFSAATIIAIVGVLLIAVAVDYAIRWFVSPNMAVIQYIIGLV